MAGIWCAICGTKYDNKSSGCFVTIQQERESIRKTCSEPSTCARLLHKFDERALTQANKLHGCEANATVITGPFQEDGGGSGFCIGHVTGS